MTTHEILAQLGKLESAQTVKIYRNHRATGSMLDRKVGNLKPIAKATRNNQELAQRLSESDNSNPMNLAGMVADGAKMNKTQLQSWVEQASWYMINEHTVPGATREHPNACSLGSNWTQSKTESIALSGWCVPSGVPATRDDQVLDLEMTKGLLERIGKVDVEVGSAACKVPLAIDTRPKVVNSGEFVTIFSDNDVFTGDETHSSKLSTHSNVESAVFRLVGFDASTAGGTLDIEAFELSPSREIAVSGNLTAIPGPNVAGMFAFFVVGIIVAQNVHMIRRTTYLRENHEAR